MPHVKPDRNLRKGKGQPYRKCDIIKIDRLEEDLLFKTGTIRVTLTCQAQACMTLPEELESGHGDSEPGLSTQQSQSALPVSEGFPPLVYSPPHALHMVTQR